MNFWPSELNLSTLMTAPLPHLPGCFLKSSLPQTYTKASLGLTIRSVNVHHSHQPGQPALQPASHAHRPAAVLSPVQIQARGKREFGPERRARPAAKASASTSPCRHGSSRTQMLLEVSHSALFLQPEPLREGGGYQLQITVAPDSIRKKRGALLVHHCLRGKPHRSQKVKHLPGQLR